jgi:HD-like signal output (HDOD) protein
VTQLCDVELPAVSSTVMKIQQLSQDESCALQSLADVILQDAAMTTHVLRLTSSAYHVRGSRSNSVTRALVMLGFNEVRAICLSVAVMDDLIKKGKQKPFITELARAFHSAAQAEQLACAVGDRSSQEVFIAALLYDLGKMLFYCFGGETADHLIDEIESSGRPEAELEREILGFELRELTQALAKKWGLGELLVKAVANEESTNSRIRGVRLGRSIAHAVEKGWDTPTAQTLIDEMCQLTGMTATVLTPMLHTAADKARVLAEEFHAVTASREIPLPPTAGATPRSPVEEQKAAPEIPFTALEPDIPYQLVALRNISLKLESSPEVQELVDLVLDGIFKGLGMDRALFAMLSPNRKYLSGKSALGYKSAELINLFRFPVEADKPNIFQWVIEGQQAVWVQNQSDAEFSRLLQTGIQQVIGTAPFFIAPTVVTGKPIGVFYADRAVSGRPIEADLFQSFKQFVMTANISLEHLKLKHAQAVSAAKSGLVPQ